MVVFGLPHLRLQVQVLIVLDSDPRSANAGVWCTMFFIYMTYTLLALHVEECTVSGLLLGFTQVWPLGGFPVLTLFCSSRSPVPPV